MIDITKLEKLAGLHYADHQKISKDIELIVNYLSQLSEIQIDESEYIYDINTKNCTQGVEDFVDAKKILTNSHHDIVNNSIVLQFKK